MTPNRTTRMLVWIGAVCFALAAVTANAQTAPGDLFDALHWRLIGPFRGGWSTVAQGIANEPDTFFFGAAGGGVWKTTDAGQTWRPVFDSVKASNVGALAIGGSDPKVLYVGTGQITSRYDIAAGDGVYKSTDSGATWRHVGLDATRHIGAIIVDPRDASKVLVAAFGHAFGSNAERGVFRSIDAGATWTKTLFVDDHTGAVDLAADPSNPDVVFASVWEARYWPWLSYFMSESSPKSGVYKSTDGGASWKRVLGSGWPAGELGRIGLATAHGAQGLRVYALVDSETTGGLYRSDDGGAHWQYINKRKALVNSYFAQLTVAPDDPDVVYVMNRSITRCDQGGAHCSIFKGAPGGDDYHQMWINPRHPDHMVAASDQGTTVSVNGGRNWSDWYNQPTGQFYHLATDNRFPYWVYSGQQDSGTAAVSTRSDYGALGPRDWHPVGANERDYDIPDPQDPNIVFGSGLGGRLSRWDARNGEVQNVSPWAVSSYGARPTDFKYRYTWITPIAISQLSPFPMYQGAQVLFRSLDQGQSWQTISPDLSSKSEHAHNCTGDLAPAAARTCGYGVIYSIGLSPRDNSQIWIGTDDGTIQLTQDGGAHWQNVTPKILPPWAKVASIDAAGTDPASAYAAIDNHRQDDFRPYILRTHDYGKTWTQIGQGLPVTDFVSVVRADPLKQGLLYAGTASGVFVSFDDGNQWRPLQNNLPTAWVRDLLVHGDDLIVATQGRAIWVLDNVSPLRQAADVAANVQAQGAILFKPADAYRLRGSQNKDTPPPADSALGQNPQTGALIDYWLASDAKRIVLEIRDASDNIISTFASDKPSAAPAAVRYFTKPWVGPPSSLSGAKGAHRFIWNLRYPRPKAAHYDYSISAVFNMDTPITPEGSLVSPGTYKVRLLVDGMESVSDLRVIADPRVSLDEKSLGQALTFAREIEKALYRDYVGYGELETVERIVQKEMEQQAPAHVTTMSSTFAAFQNTTKPLLASEGEDAENLGAIGELLSGLLTDVEGSDRSPTRKQLDLLSTTNERLDRALADWQQIKSRELVRFNEALGKVGRPAIAIPAPDLITLDEPVESIDRP
jgi:photosystem II stability/assembly factor-like uncharacterized protein